MKKFQRSELDRFNDRMQNVLENKDCVGIFKRYLRDTRPELYKVFRLWRKAHKAKTHGRAVTETMEDLMEEIDGFEGVEDGDLDNIMNQCCDILDGRVKAHFLQYLNENHRR